MSAYYRAHRALTSGQALRPAEAAQLLAELRRENGEQLADAIAAQLDGTCRRAPGDSAAAYRKKSWTFATVMRVVANIRRLSALPVSPTIPNPRTNGSTA
ncbi:hypothetical protein [Streptomyces arenae]|uniref:hypothetical protein n=1 Tax=Streptomyces arenae TaxID=29301 RepID=UPI002659D013|nr:hypothetical protein [Streptomyces arenae]MCG7204005.1 hypothetical protein [Streptomyces arenae]